MTPSTVAHQATLSVGIFRQEYQSELPLPTPGDLLEPGIKPGSPAWAGGFITPEPPEAQKKGKQAEMTSAHVCAGEPLQEAVTHAPRSLSP